MSLNLPSYEDVVRAAHTIEGHAVRTPLLQSNFLNELTNANIFIKPECLQRTGSFKFRGAYNALSNIIDDKRKLGILASSSGNHAQGVAESARLFGCPATIIMPADAPDSKKQRTLRSGATIVEYDRYNDDRDRILYDLAEKSGANIVHPYDNFHVIAGQGTVGLEISEDLQSLNETPDRVFVCAGGGGLTSGTALGMRHHFQNTDIHTVEPMGYDDYKQSLAAGRIIANAKSEPSICDAIVTPQPGEMSFALCQNLLAPGLSVSDNEALDAVAFAYHELKLVVEPGGAVALAALLSGKIEVSGETVAIILSGGNIDAEVMARALSSDP